MAAVGRWKGLALAAAVVAGPSLALAQGSQPFPTPRQVEGLPIEVRPPELATDKPTFPNQTRAPFHRSNVALQVTVVTDKLDLPWALQFLPDGRMLVTEKPGAMVVVGRDGSVSAPLKGLPTVAYAGDAGLLDVALDRDFKRNRLIYFNYIRPEPSNETRMALARARLDLASGALRDVKVIFLASETRLKAPSNNQNGRIAFAPDGTLFLGLGDRSGGPAGLAPTAQRLDTDLGKIVHISRDGAPAKDNPFIDRPGARPEIWSYGHRISEGMTFDPRGRLWETEMGPRGGDELNLIRRGGNYGWPLATHAINYSGEKINGGRTELPGGVPPVYYWDPVIAPSGLAYYEGKLFPQWDGSLLLGALRGRMLDRLTLKGDRVVSEEPLLVGLKTRIRDVRVAPDGAVYVLTDEPKVGKLLRLTPRRAGTPAVVDLAGKPVTLAIPPMALLQDLPLGPGRKMVITHCTLCHTIANVTSTRGSAQQWDATVEKMKGLGAQVDDPTKSRIVTYLATHFGSQH